MALPDIKAEALTRALYDKLTLRGYLYVSYLDSQNILISYNSVEVVNEPNIIVRIQALTDDIARTDALGLPQRVYNPQRAQILLEQSTAVVGQVAEGTTYADRVSQRQRLSVLAYELGRFGLHIEYWLGPVVGPISLASWATATEILPELGDLINPNIGEV